MATLSVKNLSKSFGPVQILKDVSITLEAGKIHALVGANGAGKSTLINILSGLFTDYVGNIKLDGAPIEIKSISAAKKYGIQTVHQEFDISLFPSLSVLENVILQSPENAFPSGWFPPRGGHEWVKNRLSKIGCEYIDLRKPVSKLRPAERQKIALAIALSENTKYLILDEPTASLPTDDAKQLLKLLVRLKSQGVGMLYVSHHLNEVFQISDEISVLREGKIVDQFPVKDEPDSAQLRDRTVGAMLNRKSVDNIFPERLEVDHVKSKRPLLEIKDMQTKTGVNGVNLKLFPKEIVAVTGLVGAGKSELLRAIFGADPLEKGELFWNGEQINSSDIRSMINRGVGYVPEDRHNLGLHLQYSVVRNMSLPFTRHISGLLGSISKIKEYRMAKELKEEVGLVASSLDLPVSSLSGGNQQKVVLAKWLRLANSALLLDEPTKGVDIGAKSSIYQMLRDLANKGLGVLIATSEVDEAIGNADRVIVMYRGTVVYETVNQNIDADTLMSKATMGLLGGVVNE